MIFGTGSAQFQEEGSGVIALSYSNIEPEYIIPEEDKLTSVITGHNTYITRGDYSDFNVTVNLWKYTDPKAKFQELYTYLHSNVWFWSHNDGKAISGSGAYYNTPVKFHITDMEHSYLDNNVYRDILKIKFEAIDFTCVTGSLK